MSPKREPGEHRPARVILLGALAVVLLIAYPLVVREAQRAAGPAVAVIPCALLLALSSLALPRSWRLPAWLAVGIVSILAVGTGNVSALSKWPPILINLGLAWRFCVTLGKAKEPLISRFARAERGTLEPDLARYTRQLTAAWVAFFVTMAIIAGALGALPGSTAWAWFTSIGNWLCVAAFVVGEWVWRRLRFPQYPHASLLRQLSLVTRRWRG